MNEWINSTMVQEHNDWFNLGIHNTNNFLPWHRVHLQMFEDFVRTKSQGYKFIPFPYFDGNGSIPRPFNGLDINGNSIEMVDDDYWGQGYTLSNVNPTYSYNTGSFETNLNNCISSWADVGNYTNGLESYHNGGHGAIGGIMNSGLSPMAYVFWMWHAWIDEQWYFYEDRCAGEFTIYDLSDHIITLPSGTITWSTDQWVKGRVVVPNGSTLVINNGAKIYFLDSKYNTMKTNITVQAGGRLVIDNATLTGIDIMGNQNGGTGESVGVKYNTPWDGIIVEGVSSSSSSTVQGHVTLKNGAKIEHARIGILSQRGGRVYATDAVFENNRIDAQFNSYAYYHNSYFIRCTFTTTADLRDAVWTSTNINGQPRTHHINESLHHCPDNHVRLNSVKSIRFYNCHWIDTHFDNIPSCKGITSFNSNFFVNSASTFENLAIGIYASNSGCGPRGVPSIYSSIFTNCLEGVVLNGVDYAGIGNNIFNIPATNTFTGSTITPAGIFAKGSSAFMIRNNQFLTDGGGTSLDNIGVIVENSSANYANVVYLNTFTGVGRGTQAQQNNASLQISCNNYNIVGNSGSYGVTVTSGTLADQGDCGTKPAGNLWDNMGCSGDESQIYKAGVANSFIYNAHSDRIPTCVSSGVSPTDCNKNEEEAPCVPPNPCGNQPCTICCLEHQVSLRTGQIDDLIKLIDANRTAELLSLIGNPSSSPITIKNELMASSPLSDEVLLAAINKMSLGNVHLKEIVIKNSGLTENVYSELRNKRYTTMPVTMKKQIDEVQATISERKQIEMEIANRTFERQFYIQEGVRHFVENDSIEQAVEFLTQYKILAYPCDLVAVEVALKNVGGALDELANMPEGTADEIANKKVVAIELDVLNSGRELEEIDANEEQKVREISLTPTKGSAHAEAILELSRSEKSTRFAEPIVPNSTAVRTSSSQQDELTSTELGNEPKLLRNYPNPFTENTTIEFIVTEGASSAYIRVYDMMGKEVAYYNVTDKTGVSAVEFGGKDVSKGVYFYHLIIDGAIADKQKMIVIK